MKVDKKVEKNACVVSLTVKAEPDEIKDACKKVLNAFVRNGSIPGFRPGKAPVEVVKNKFAAEIKQETQGECFRMLYPKALEEAGLNPVAMEGVTEATLAPETGFSFTVIVEVRPEYKLPKYKGISIKPGDTAVSEEAVTKQIEDFRKAFAKFEDAKEGDAISEGDFVQFDYDGTLKGKPLAEVVADVPAVCGAKGYWTQLEEGRFLPEILEALKGLKVGDETTAKVKFAKDNAPEPLKGKTCEYALKVLAFRKRQLPDDAKFVEDAKAESMEKLRADTRARLEKQAADAEAANRKNQAIEALVKKADFDVPPSLVQRQTEAYLSQLAQQMQYAGVTSDYIEQHREEILKDATERATTQVRLSYVLLDIADAEKIEVDEKDEAKRDQARAEKTLDFVLANAK